MSRVAHMAMGWASALMIMSGGATALDEMPPWPGERAQETDDQARRGLGEGVGERGNGGLLMRRATMSESILLLETQLQQAKLVAELLELLGPEAQIEIAPGEFRSFGDTPIGRALRREQREAEMQMRIRRIELESEAVAARAVLMATLLPPVPPTPGDHLSVEEIYGTAGAYRAVLMIGGRRMTVRVGDEPAQGMMVVTIDEAAVELVLGEDVVRLEIDR